MRRIGFILVLLTLTILITACNDTEDGDVEKENTIVPVEVTEVEEGNLIVKRAVYGKTSPIKQTSVLLQQPGEIKELNVTNGDQVDENDRLATVKTEMGDKHIDASMNGKIAGLTAQEDAIQSNEEPLMMIMDTEKLQATFSVTASNQKLFEKEESATVFIDDKKYKSTVQSIDDLPNDTGQYEIKVELENKHDILPGTAAKLEISETRVKDTLIIPTEAIVTETDETFVFMTDGDKAKKVAVEVTETQTDQSAVKGDLKEEDQIIVKGQFTLSDGTEISIKEGNEA